MSAQATSTTSTTEASEFLAKHPEILLGRDALDGAEAEAGDDTFSIVYKPLSNMILLQYYDADTLERVFAAALVDDDKALQYYKRQNGYQGDEDDSEPEQMGCPECGAGSSAAVVQGPDRFLHERMVTCPASCSRKQVGRIWPA